MSGGRRGDAQIVSCGHSFLESPRWHDGALYASDFYTHEVLRWLPDTTYEVLCEVPGCPSGLGWGPQGELLVVSMTDRRLLRLERTGALTEVANLWDHAPWHLNDMVVDPEGRAYIGNFGWDDETDDAICPTVLLRVDPTGEIAVAAEELVNPNGMALTPDGRTLLVSETFAARITAFDRSLDGELTGRRVWASFSDRTFETVSEALDSGAILPDGIALDRSGALWVGDCGGTGAIRVAEGGQRARARFNRGARGVCGRARRAADADPLSVLRGAVRSHRSSARPDSVHVLSDRARCRTVRRVVTVNAWLTFTDARGHEPCSPGKIRMR